jgi:hypothetical protein
MNARAEVMKSTEESRPLSPATSKIKEYENIHKLYHWDESSSLTKAFQINISPYTVVIQHSPLLSENEGI